MRPAKSWHTPGPAKRRKPALVLLLVAAALQWGFLAAESSPRPAVAQTASRPNIVLIRHGRPALRHAARHAEGAAPTRGARDDIPSGDRDESALLSFPSDDPHRPVLPHDGCLQERGSERWLARLPVVGVGHDRDHAARGGVPDGARSASTSTGTWATGCMSRRAGIGGSHSRPRTSITTTPSMTIGWVASRTQGCRRITRPT